MRVSAKDAPNGTVTGVQPIPSSDEELNPHRWMIMIGLITATILQVLDSTVVNVALPQMAGNLSATTEEIGWVATGYILSSVIVLPMTAWLSGRFGRKRYLTGSILLFITASFFCGTSRTLPELVFWRVIQGVGGAALLSTAQATLREIFPLEQQGMVQAIFMMGVMVAPTVGPTLGGYITDNYNWPWIFFINIPIGLFSAGMVYAFLHDSPYQKRALSIDWWGIGLLAVGMGCLQYVLEEGNRDDWFDSSTIVILSVVSSIALIGLLAWELSPWNQHPIVNFRVLKNRDLAAGSFLFVALGFGLYGGMFIFPLFAQDILHFTPTLTGMTMMPGAAATAVSVMVCGKLFTPGRQLVPGRILIFFGLAVFIFSMWILGHLSSTSAAPNVQLGLIVRGIGLGFLSAPINLSALSTLRGSAISEGTALMNLMRQLGGSFGIAVLGTYVTNNTNVHRAALIAHVSPVNPVYQHTLMHITHELQANGLTFIAAQKAAFGLIAQMLDIQTITMSYNDAFLLIGMTCLFVSPTIFLLRNRLPVGTHTVEISE